MKPALVFVVCLTCFVFTGSGQHFGNAWKDSLAVPMTAVQAEWVSLDPDTLLDVVLVGRTSSGELRLAAYQHTGAALVERSALSTGFLEGYVQLADWNRDNRVDILMAGKTLSGADALYVFENLGNFMFSKSATPLLVHNGPFRVADLNADGRADLVTAGAHDTSSFIRVYANSQDGLGLVFTSDPLQAADVIIADFNDDGHPDVAASGNIDHVPALLQFIHDGRFHFRAAAVREPLAGALSANDQNADGRMDLFAAGTSAEGVALLAEWRGDTSGLQPFRSYPAPTRAALFTGDMNMDGVADRWVNGIDPLGRRVNYVQLADAVFIPLDTAGLLVQRAGDADFDGDLDILQVVDSARRTWLKILLNKSAVKNKRPSPPPSAFAFSTYDRTFVFWEMPTDDHTNALSLTYDVWLGTETNTVMISDLDQASGHRMRVTHGNAGMQQSMMIRQLTDDRYFYRIQTVDNSFSGSYTSGTGGGLCTGGVRPCFDLVHEGIKACRDSPITLHAEAPAYWFSTSRGFIAKDSTFLFTASANDTIISFSPQQADCSKNKIWTVEVVDGPPSEQKIVYSCLDAPRTFRIPPGWESNTWNTTPVAENLDSIRMVIDKEMVLVVQAVAPGGCTYQHSFDIRISAPTLTLRDDSFRIGIGQSVYLEATSSATKFLWTPPEGLNNAAIANPTASPRRNTTYSLLATDSVGCTIEGSVEILVDETAVVPNLFTPNGDGSNDHLLIYGLTNAADFSFRIYNREGATVYETTDLIQATAAGWNGDTRGSPQPGGVYYWKVEGVTPNGDPVLLNGAKMGSVLLIR